eukprot:TRINITY_DN89725_c0_g1_i1.p1 TRINITY_DN89725_c0_g1~~TRINITY_DN89725_c0_g1_i1.p1  ORF type:complete len:658 (-),score=92.48 TRINITY_DN89725_c0_g1_i1:1710-3683(-)
MNKPTKRIARKTFVSLEDECFEAAEPNSTSMKENPVETGQPLSPKETDNERNPFLVNSLEVQIAESQEWRKGDPRKSHKAPPISPTILYISEILPIRKQSPRCGSSRIPQHSHECSGVFNMDIEEPSPEEIKDECESPAEGGTPALDLTDIEVVGPVVEQKSSSLYKSIEAQVADQNYEKPLESEASPESISAKIDASSFLKDLYDRASINLTPSKEAVLYNNYTITRTNHTTFESDVAKADATSFLKELYEKVSEKPSINNGLRSKLEQNFSEPEFILAKLDANIYLNHLYERVSQVEDEESELEDLLEKSNEDDNELVMALAKMDTNGFLKDLYVRIFEKMLPEEEETESLVESEQTNHEVDFALAKADTNSFLKGLYEKAFENMYLKEPITLQLMDNVVSVDIPLTPSQKEEYCDALRVSNESSINQIASPLETHKATDVFLNNEQKESIKHVSVVELVEEEEKESEHLQQIFESIKSVEEKLTGSYQENVKRIEGSVMDLSKQFTDMKESMNQVETSKMLLQCLAQITQKLKKMNTRVKQVVNDSLSQYTIQLLEQNNVWLNVAYNYQAQLKAQLDEKSEGLKQVNEKYVSNIINQHTAQKLVKQKSNSSDALLLETYTLYRHNAENTKDFHVHMKERVSNCTYYHIFTINQT